MKQKLGFLCTVLLLSCLLAAPSFAEDAEEEVPVGTRLGSVYTTDIVTYIDGAESHRTAHGFRALRTRAGSLNRTGQVKVLDNEKGDFHK